MSTFGTIERYEHHGRTVFAISRLRGKHRDNCLCFQNCAKFKPNQPDNCPIAKANYRLCVKYGITAPVGECPEYQAGDLGHAE
jgi:hypothetical protein